MDPFDAFLYFGSFFGGIYVVILGIKGYLKEKITVAGNVVTGKKAKNISLILIISGLAILGNLIRILMS
ncbi:MAG: hypothetical protein D6748_04575 [Calditrichaeota bacterium]|nr:MAG: hypothetical protein D6748_04575 [Calditrichota bacterium]